MEKWLDAFAKGLLIQSSTEAGSQTESASAEQMEAFKKALKASLDFHGKYQYVDDTITYDYRMGTIRGGSKLKEATHVLSPNATLSSVLSKLPKLEGGKFYTFPTPTFLSLRIKDKSGDKAEFAVINACSWIQQNL